MNTRVHSFNLVLDWELLEQVSGIDRFDASWTSIEKRERASLKQLKAVATVRSVGASTRIEGSRMSDDEVDVLLRQIDVIKVEDRDSQEVLGYFDTLDLITESYRDIEITEGNIKYLHKLLLKHCERDQLHRGDYKIHPNAVEATSSDGTTQLIFHTTDPGYPTQDAMRALFAWYEEDTRTHPLVKCAVFVYGFVSIHPFQDGNGRLSRLLSTLLLLKHGYTWIQYISVEHEIEHRKAVYYRELRDCQSQRPGEDISSWIRFFLEMLGNTQMKLKRELAGHGAESQLTPREKMLLTFIGAHSGCRSGEIAKKLDIPSPTVKRALSDLLRKGMIVRYGKGPGTNYSLP